MKIITYIFILFILANTVSKAQTIPNPNLSLDKRNSWSQKDLIEPSELASIIVNPKARQAKIFNIGVVDDIKGAINIGGVSKKVNLEKFNLAIKNLPGNTFLVVYCGCCPFEKCPNIRPAFNMVKSMGFTTAKLLNLPVNMKQDWIDKGYPLADKKH